MAHWFADEGRVRGKGKVLLGPEDTLHSSARVSFVPVVETNSSYQVSGSASLSLVLYFINDVRLIARSQGPNESTSHTVILLTTKLTRGRNDKGIIPKLASNFKIRGSNFPPPARNLVFLSLPTLLPLISTQHSSQFLF